MELSAINWPSIVDILIVALIGSLVGATELLSRYRDAPFTAIVNRFAIVYIVLNIVAATLALGLLRLFDVTFGIEAPSEKLRWVQVMTAGLGAMVLFRSSLFMINAGSQTISVGPSTILEFLLSVLDSEVDRARATTRAAIIAKVMDEVSFTKAKDVLPLITFALMQNLPTEFQNEVFNRVNQLEKDEMAEMPASHALGLALMDVVGEEVLREAVKLLGDEVKLTEAEQKINEALKEARAPETQVSDALRNALGNLSFSVDEVEPADEDVAVEDATPAADGNPSET